MIQLKWTTGHLMNILDNTYKQIIHIEVYNANFRENPYRKDNYARR